MQRRRPVLQTAQGPGGVQKPVALIGWEGSSGFHWVGTRNNLEHVPPLSFFSPHFPMSWAVYDLKPMPLPVQSYPWPRVSSPGCPECRSDIVQTLRPCHPHIILIGLKSHHRVHRYVSIWSSGWGLEGGGGRINKYLKYSSSAAKFLLGKDIFF